MPSGEYISFFEYESTTVRMHGSKEASQTGIAAERRTVLHDSTAGYSEAVEEEAPTVEGESLSDYRVTRRRRRSRSARRRSGTGTHVGVWRVVVTAGALSILLVTVRVIGCFEASILHGATPRRRLSGATLRKLAVAKNEAGPGFDDEDQDGPHRRSSDTLPLTLSYEDFLAKYINCPPESDEEGETVILHLLQKTLARVEKGSAPQSLGGEAVEVTEPVTSTPAAEVPFLPTASPGDDDPRRDLRRKGASVRTVSGSDKVPYGTVVVLLGLGAASLIAGGVTAYFIAPEVAYGLFGGAGLASLIATAALAWKLRKKRRLT